MTGREGIDLLLSQRHQALGLACENNTSAFIECVIKRSYSDGISCGDPLIVSSVIDNTCKFRIQLLEHLRSVFKIHGKQNLAVAVTLKGISFALKFIS